MFETDDLRIENLRPLLPPAILLEEFPLGERSSRTVAEGRRQVHQVLSGEDDRLVIKQGRHPVVEALGGQERFIPNDAVLDAVRRQVLILTGPNMGGKSTFLRQTALISILAQAGSFVPAREAHLPVLDRAFSRVPGLTVEDWTRI